LPPPKWGFQSIYFPWIERIGIECPSGIEKYILPMYEFSFLDKGFGRTKHKVTVIG
jgi:hypothetical protein